MARTYDLLVRARGDTKDADRAMKQLQRSVRGFGDGMAKVGRGLTAAVTLPIVAMGAVGVRELSDMQLATAQTNAVLKSTGGVAGVTSKQVARLASSLSKVSGIDDQVIQGGENILLTFTKIGAKDGVFDRATRAALDLSVAFGKDMNSSAVLVGKALQDPVKGVSALSRVGVSFTKEQKKVIERLVETGQSAKAQKLILRELETQVKGSAAAYGTTAAGAVGRLKEQFSGIAAQMVTNLLPAFNQLSGYLQRGMNWFEGLDASTKKLIGTMLLIGAALGPVLWALGSMVSASAALIPVLVGITGPVALVIAGVAAFGVALVVAYRKSDQFRATVHRAFQQVRSSIVQLVASARATGAAWAALWRKYGDDVMRILGPAMRAMVTMVGTQMANIKDAALAVMALLRGDWSSAWNLLKGIVTRTLGAIVGLLKGAGTTWVRILGAQGKAILSLGGKFLDWGMQLGAKIVEGVKQGIQNNAGSIASFAANALGGPVGNAVNSAIDVAEASARKGGRKGRGGGRAGGVNVLGQLVGTSVSSQSVMSYVATSTSQPYSVTRNEDGTETLNTNSAAVAFIQKRIEANKKLLEAKLKARTAAIKKRAALAAAYGPLVKRKAAAAKAKNAKQVAAVAKLMTANLEKRISLTNTIQDLDIEILALGGSVQEDTESLVAPEVDTTPDATSTDSGGDTGSTSSTTDSGPLGPIGGSSSTSGAAGDSGLGWTPVGLTSASAVGALGSSVNRALGSLVTINAQSADAEAIARRVSFILAGSRLRMGGGI